MRIRLSHKLLLVLSLLIYVASLPCKAGLVEQFSSGVTKATWLNGGEMLVQGSTLIATLQFPPLFVLALIIFGIAWFANLILLIAWFMISFGAERRKCAYTSYAALIVGGSFVLTHGLNATAVGYWLWLASMGLAIWSAVAMPERNATPPSAPAQA